MKNKKKTVLDFFEMKKNGEKIAWLTAYDYPTAYALEQAGIDLILVGDSGAMCQHGHDSTLPATLETQIEMTRAVKRGAPNTFVVGDMPYGTTNTANIHEAVKNAVTLTKETGCDAIKFEGFDPELVKAMRDSGLVVFGHLGLMPQSSAVFGGYKSQRLKTNQISQLGADFVLLEATKVRTDINFSLYTPVVFGIGAGPYVDGQLLIINDILGFYPNFKPKFAKTYWDKVDHNHNGGMIESVKRCVEEYIHEVKSGVFPSEEYWYK